MEYGVMRTNVKLPRKPKYNEAVILRKYGLDSKQRVQLVAKD